MIMCTNYAFAGFQQLHCLHMVVLRMRTAAHYWLCGDKLNMVWLLFLCRLA